jgi:hypothetical protein
MKYPHHLFVSFRCVVSVTFNPDQGHTSSSSSAWFRVAWFSGLKISCMKHEILMQLDETVDSLFCISF